MNCFRLSAIIIEFKWCRRLPEYAFACRDEDPNKIEKVKERSKWKFDNEDESNESSPNNDRMYCAYC